MAWVIRISDELLQYPMAVWSPCVLAASFLILISVTRLIAVALGHVEDLIFPAVSPATRLAPEYWIWAIGVALTLTFGMLPMSVLTYRALLSPRGDAMPACSWGCCLPPSILTAYACACLFLFGLAAIPLQENILEIKDPTQLKTQSIVHLTCAAAFFATMIVTADVIVVWQWLGRSDPSCGKRIGSRSLKLKTVLAASTLFPGKIGLPAAYTYLVVFYGREFADREIDKNAGGASQRALITLTVLFVASFTFEIKAMQLELAGSGARTPMVGPPVAVLDAGGAWEAQGSTSAPAAWQGGGAAAGGLDRADTS